MEDLQSQEPVSQRVLRIIRSPRTLTIGAIVLTAASVASLAISTAITVKKEPSNPADRAIKLARSRMPNTPWSWAQAPSPSQMFASEPSPDGMTQYILGFIPPENALLYQELDPATSTGLLYQDRKPFNNGSVGPEDTLIRLKYDSQQPGTPPQIVGESTELAPPQEKKFLERYRAFLKRHFPEEASGE